MNRQEFDALTENAKGKATDKEFNIIQTVYNFHPAINDVDGKGQIVRLYLEFGMAVIKDMLRRAENLMVLDRELHKAQVELDRVRNEIVKASR